MTRRGEGMVLSAATPPPAGSYPRHQTSLITILSSEHGRMRREQRDISIRDLQKAVKYGTRRRSGWKGRWVVEYDGIVFITDETMRREITSYPAPLAEAPVDRDQLENHAKTKQVIDHKPDLCSTHTVLVVDNSGSMATHDIDLYRCRQTAAYTMTALEFIAEQMFNGTASNRDLFSLVEFSRTAKIVFAREPLSWVLYNKLLSRRDQRTFEKRQSAQTDDVFGSNSNYLPALEQAEKLLAEGNHETCALNLYFLSDGAPTDASHLGLTPDALKRKLVQRMKTIASRFGNQLNIQLVGFGSSFSDFSTLRSMAQAANKGPEEAKAEFLFCDKMANKMRTAASSLIASSSLTRTSLMEQAAVGKSRRTMRSVASEKVTGAYSDWRFYRIQRHVIFDPLTGDFAEYNGLPYGALRYNNNDRDVKEVERRQRNPPKLLGINSAHCGMGAERVAFRCQLADGRRSPMDFVLGPMVAKETKLVERVEEHVEFHRAFCETQDLAQHLADEFNKRLQALFDYDKSKTPKISFLECSVLVLEDREWKNGERGVLVEKMLDTNKFKWTKWNDNAGGVNGSVAPIDVDIEFAKLKSPNRGFDGVGTGLGAVAEGDSDEEEESDVSNDEKTAPIPRFGLPRQRQINDTGSTVTLPSDYLQAFTHFTYLYTSKKVMVCDLQGIYNTDMCPPTFELSDPAIHYASRKGRQMVFGRTDKGKEGMQLFFNTSICKFLQLSKKNKNWRKDWHRERGRYKDSPIRHNTSSNGGWPEAALDFLRQKLPFWN